MEDIIKKIEEAVKGYMKKLNEKPIGTAIKTLLIIWVATKVIKMLKK
jgi:hypothetical protein